jgi:hypothetical protein
MIEQAEISADRAPQRLSAVATADGSARSLASAGRRIGAGLVKTTTLAGGVDAVATNGKVDLCSGAAHSAMEPDAVSQGWLRAGVQSA